MSIREHLKKIQRPYTRWQWGFGLMYLIALPAMMIAVEKTAPQGLFWGVVIPSMVSILAPIGFLATALILMYRIRCPKCDNPLRGQWQRWKYCPFCATDLDDAIDAGDKGPSAT